MDTGISEESIGTGVVGGGFEEEVELIKEKEQREPGEFQGVPGWGRASLNGSESEGDKIGELCLDQPGRVLKT